MSNSINSVNSQPHYSVVKTQPTEPASMKKSTPNNTIVVETPLEDSVVLGDQTPNNGSANKIYTRDTAKANMLKQVTEQNLNILRRMVNNLLSNQSQIGKSLLNVEESYFNFRFDLSFLSETSNFDFSFSYEKYSFHMEYIRESGMLEINQATRDEAAALIGENGPFGVKAVSERILEFAKAISGGDTSKIDLLRDAFIAGYNEAATLFGGNDMMPEISLKTYDAVIAGFETWAN